jgi:magnesium-transporting ATPase (P-type)
MSENLKVLLFVVANLFLLGLTVYDITIGKQADFFSIVQLSILLILFFSFFTWGKTGDKEKVTPDEELGQKIIWKSSFISYKLLTVFIFLLIIIEQLIHNSISIFLIVIFALALITLPIIEFFQSKKYK